MYYVAVIIREISSGEGRQEFFGQCLSGFSKEWVDKQLLQQLRQERQRGNSFPSFYRRGRGATFQEAIGQAIEQLRKVCQEKGIDLDKVQGLKHLLEK